MLEEKRLVPLEEMMLLQLLELPLLLTLAAKLLLFPEEKPLPLDALALIPAAMHLGERLVGAKEGLLLAHARPLGRKRGRR